MYNRRRAFLARAVERSHRDEPSGPDSGVGGGFGPGPGFGPGLGFGAGPGGPRGHRGGRVRRGKVRAAVLALLSERPQHGYQLITELARLSGGRWKPSPGSIYPVLAQLSDEGLVRPEEVDGRRVFHLTDAGQTAAEQATPGPKPWEGRAGEGGAGEGGAAHDGVDLREAVGALAGAAREVARTGSEAQATQARTVIEEARRAIYRILADLPAQDG